MPEPPAVLLTSGMAGAAYDWEPVLTALSAPHHVHRLERPGLDGRTPPPGLPSLHDEADLLSAAADRHGGAVVVAHSVSALHAEAMGRRHPSSLRALVLLDPSCGSASPHPEWSLLAAEALGRHAATCIAPFGPAIWTAGARAQTSRPLPPAVRSAGRARFRSPAALTAAWQEYLAFEPMLRDLAVLRQRTTFPPVPVWILTAVGGMRASAAVRWTRCHTRLARLLGGRHRLLPHSRHQLAWECPDVVVETIEAATESGR
ncbi:alpha/beta hydrolase [Saccharopolyspora sp. NPDC049426]|uniref:alpha/beta fold hydrolase n=1 Tax=Saccharopolyspora sp. NPDC049426 TaxID=3155652 RepID=UPI003413EBBB